MGKRGEWCPDSTSSSVTEGDQIESDRVGLGLGLNDMRGNQRGDDTQYGYLGLLKKNISINQDIQKGLVFLQTCPICVLGAY